MPTFQLKDGVLTSKVYVQVTRDYQCQCGTDSTLTMSLPEGVSYTSEITVKNAHCPGCGKVVVIPYGHHYIENYRLLTKAP